MIRRALSWAVRIGVVGAGLFFVVRGVNWPAVVATLRTAHPGPLLAVVAINALMMTVKAARLRLLLRGAADLKACLLAKLTVSAMNNVVPFRGGDMARVWMLERHAGISKSGAAAVGVVEAFFELAALAPIAALGALATHQRWAAVAAPVLGVAAGGLVALSRRLARPSKRPQPRATWIRRLRARIQPGLRPLREPGVLARALVASLLSWGLEVMMLALCARALGLPVPPALAAVVLLAINVALAVPASPAGAGAFEGAVVVVLTLAGIPKSPAVAFALLYHLVQAVPVVLAGALVVWRSGLTLDRLPAARQPVTSAIARPSQPLIPTV